MADTSVESSNALFKILAEWEEYLKVSGFEPDEIAVDNCTPSKPEEPQP